MRAEGGVVGRHTGVNSTGGSPQPRLRWPGTGIAVNGSRKGARDAGRDRGPSSSRGSAASRVRGPPHADAERPPAAAESLSDDAVVGVTGFEPAASSSRTTRATKLRHTPLQLEKSTLLEAVLRTTEHFSLETVGCHRGEGRRWTDAALTPEADQASAGAAPRRARRQAKNPVAMATADRPPAISNGGAETPV